MTCCRELIEFLLDYVSGELPASTRSAFDDHLAACPPCVAYLNTYVKSVELARLTLLDNVEQTPPMPEELVQAILSARAH